MKSKSRKSEILKIWNSENLNILKKSEKFLRIWNPKNSGVFDNSENPKLKHVNLFLHSHGAMEEMTQTENSMKKNHILSYDMPME